MKDEGPEQSPSGREANSWESHESDVSTATAPDLFLQTAALGPPSFHPPPGRWYTPSLQRLDKLINKTEPKIIKIF